MIYFTVRAGIKNLSQEQKGDLLDAILNYADPNGGEKPDFSNDKLLETAWNFILPALDRDDERYQEVSKSRRYANFCGILKQKNLPKVDRVDWEMMDCPTYKQWAEKRAYADTCGHMPAYAGTCPPVSASSPTTVSLSASTAVSGSVSNAEPQAACAHVSPAVEASPPEIRKIFDQWVEYKAAAGKELVRQSQDYLVEDLEANVEKYGIVAVEALVREAIANGWKTLYFEKLKENSSRYDPQRFPPAAQEQSNKGSGASSAMDDLRILRQMFQEDGS